MQNKFIKMGFIISRLYEYQLKNPDLLSKELLYKNVKEGEFESFSFIDKDYIDESYNLFTPIVIEIFMNNLEIVKDLVNKGYDYNENIVGGLTPIMIATYLNRIEIIEYLYSIDKNIFLNKNEKGQDVFKLACNAKNKNLVEKIVSDVDINSVDNLGYNALFYTINNQENFINLNLLDNEIIVSKYKNNNNSYYKRLEKEYEISKILLSNGIDVNHTIETPAAITRLNFGSDRTCKRSIISKLDFQDSYYHLDRMIKLFIEYGSAKTILREDYPLYEQYEYSFAKLKEDIKDRDISEWSQFTKEYIDHLKLEKLVKNHELTIEDEITGLSISGRAYEYIKCKYKNGKKIY